MTIRVVVYLRNVGTEEDECWVPCAKRDPGSVSFVQSGTAQQPGLAHAFRNADAKDWEHLDLLLGHSGPGKFWRAVFAEVRPALAAQQPNAELEGIICWSDADGSGYEYAIQQGPHGDEFVQLYNRPCLRRKAALAPQPALEATDDPYDPSPHCPLDACRREGCTRHAHMCLSKQPAAPSPALDPATVEAIARIINPVAFTALERSYIVPQPEEFMDMKIAREKAEKIRALLASPGPRDAEAVSYRLCARCGIAAEDHYFNGTRSGKCEGFVSSTNKTGGE